jgi:hypothetical protein
MGYGKIGNMAYSKDLRERVIAYLKEGHTRRNEGHIQGRDDNDKELVGVAFGNRELG